MYALMVSEDAGKTYNLLMEHESVDVLLERTNRLDLDYLRWVIKDEEGELLDIRCPIHSDILKSLGGSPKKIIGTPDVDNNIIQKSFLSMVKRRAQGHEAEFIDSFNEEEEYQ